MICIFVAGMQILVSLDMVQYLAQFAHHKVSIETSDSSHNVCKRPIYRGVDGAAIMGCNMG